MSQLIVILFLVIAVVRAVTKSRGQGAKPPQKPVSIGQEPETVDDAPEPRRAKARKRESTDAPHGRRLDRNRLFKRRDTRSVRAAKARRRSRSRAETRRSIRMRTRRKPPLRWTTCAARSLRAKFCQSPCRCGTNKTPAAPRSVSSGRGDRHSWEVLSWTISAS